MAYLIIKQKKKGRKYIKKIRNPICNKSSILFLLNRWIEEELQQVLGDERIGTIAFVPLAQGLLTNKYLKGIPADSRAAGTSKFLGSKDITDEKLKKIYTLNEIQRKEDKV